MINLFYTLTKLQGSQTVENYYKAVMRFYTLTKLQGSQTEADVDVAYGVFYTLTKLQGSQTLKDIRGYRISFTLLQNYKVLKLYRKR